LFNLQEGRAWRSDTPAQYKTRPPEASHFLL
jgi:hypothetical protein